LIVACAGLHVAFVREQLVGGLLLAWTTAVIALDATEREKRAERAKKEGRDPEPLLQDTKTEPTCGDPRNRRRTPRAFLRVLRGDGPPRGA
jgi:hypothetical protein